jgi:hypothetical protein
MVGLAAILAGSFAAGAQFAQLPAMRAVSISFFHQLAVDFDILLRNSKNIKN